MGKCCKVDSYLEQLFAFFIKVQGRVELVYNQYVLWLLEKKTAPVMVCLQNHKHKRPVPLNKPQHRVWFLKPASTAHNPSPNPGTARSMYVSMYKFMTFTCIQEEAIFMVILLHNL